MKSESIYKILNNNRKFEIIARSSFNFVDEDKSGFIEYKELKRLLTQLSKDLKIECPSDNEVKEILEQLDIDKSGNIEYKEFTVFLKDLLVFLLEADY